MFMNIVGDAIVRLYDFIFCRRRIIASPLEYANLYCVYKPLPPLRSTFHISPEGRELKITLWVKRFISINL